MKLKLLHSNTQIRDLIYLGLLIKKISCLIDTYPFPKDFSYFKSINSIKEIIKQDEHIIKLELEKYNKYSGKKAIVTNTGYRTKLGSIGIIKEAVLFNEKDVLMHVNVENNIVTINLTDLQEI